ncbi:hypothetical protein C84B14_10987 [Salinisphaera sp. C84B14]|uniref:hypothetical protein n=1 Tax=unclassified Salinisphaera TaxID=2649847 RepID=UPI000C6A0CC8|nr:hypothetical protein [Salinisphaera sp.]MBS64286.1 hypothetical protein [Salinisphaera sp.]
MMRRLSIRRLVATSRHFTLLILLGASALAHGHAGHSGNEDDATVRAVLDPLPAELEGVRVQLRRTLAPQLLVANPGERPLTILDDNGRAFLRIGGGVVEADLGAAAFHRSNTLMAPGTFSADASRAPNWQEVEPAANWGWFDLRLRTDTVAVADTVRREGKSADVGEWRIPVQYGDTRSAISGRFQFVPEPTGIPEARVTNALASNVVVRAMNGSARAGLFLSYAGDAALVVHGADAEPMLRFDERGVAVNRHSTTWQQAAPAGAPGYEAGNGVSWAEVSSQPRYGWVDPRIGHLGEVESDDNDNVIKRWSIPVTIGEREDAIEGVTEWKPVAPIARAP